MSQKNCICFVLGTTHGYRLDEDEVGDRNSITSKLNKEAQMREAKLRKA